MCFYKIVSFSTPIELFQLVKGYNKLCDAKTSGKNRVFFCCSLESIPSAFKSTCKTVKHKNSTISLCCPCNHISNKIAMTWCIENRKVSIWSLKMSSTHFNSYPSSLFFFSVIKNIGKMETSFAIFFCFLFMFAHLTLPYFPKFE